MRQIIRKMKEENILSMYIYSSWRWKFRNGIEYDWSSARTVTDRSFRFKSYQAVCFSSCKTCQLSTSYSPTRSLWLLLSPTGEKWETKRYEGRERMGWETLKSARWGSLLQTLRDSGAKLKRDGIAPARFYGSFRFTYIIKIPHAADLPQTILLSAKRVGRKKELLDRGLGIYLRTTAKCIHVFDLYECIPRQWLQQRANV